MLRSIYHLLVTAALTLLSYFTRPLDFPHFPESYHARVSKYNPKHGSFWGHLIPMEGPPVGGGRGGFLQRSLLGRCFTHCFLKLTLSCLMGKELRPLQCL